jgi:molecular chaperone DnaJ
LRGRGRGDQIIVYNVRTPARLSKRQEELLREFEKLENETAGGNNRHWSFLGKKKDHR